LIAAGVTVVLVAVAVSVGAWTRASSSSEAASQLPPMPSASSPLPSPQVAAPFELEAGSGGVEGWPDGYVTVQASDGSFSIVASTPPRLTWAEQGFWQIEFDGGPPYFTMYIYPEIDEPSEPAAYARHRLLSWVDQFGEPGKLTSIELGSATGWRVRVEAGGGYRGEAQLITARGVEYTMSYLVSDRAPHSDIHLGRGFLDSFHAPVAGVGAPA
jgi:hypothetical protein